MDNQEIEKAEMSQNIGGKEFLQSTEWLKFQEAFGRRTFSVEDENFSAKIIEHVLPIVGRYFYVPRGPILKVASGKLQVESFLNELIELSKKEHAGWVRIEPGDSRLLDPIRLNSRVAKAPYDVQPKEVFKIDISKPEEQLLAEMKSKTRYNIRLAQKHGVSLRITNGYECANNTCIEKFLELTKEMARRQGIVSHSEEYYRKMFETFSEDMLRLYCAEYDGKIIAANLMLFFGDTATYLHGASSNENRNVMAPFLLQWQAIMDAQKCGCRWYDFGGVQTGRIEHKKHSDLSGVTAFKTGFSPMTEPVVFPGTYDMIINQRQYALYKGLQKAKMLIKKFRK
jgi:lipid II:glycine glycyltransferase (peptidoglycan interpeptide bridge formation enzyme)